MVHCGNTNRLLPLLATLIIGACSSTAAPAEFTATVNPELRTAVPTRTALPSSTEPPPSESARPAEEEGATGEFISVPEPPTLDFAEGVPISGAQLLDLLRSTGHMVREAQFHFSTHSSFGCNLRLVEGQSSFEQRFSTHTIAVGDRARAAVIGVLIYPSEEQRSTDWTIDPESRAARLMPAGECALARAGVVGAANSDDPLFGFFSTGFAIESAIGYANIVVVFAEREVPGGNELGGNGLDPAIQAQLATLIRSLDDEPR